MPEIKPVERCVYSVKFEVCRCHNYEINKDRIGTLPPFVEHPKEYCDNLIGFRPDNWVTVRTWLGELMDWAKKNNY